MPIFFKVAVHLISPLLIIVLLYYLYYCTIVLLYYCTIVLFLIVLILINPAFGCQNDNETRVCMAVDDIQADVNTIYSTGMSRRSLLIWSPALA